ncbi:MAG: hypothetical protein KGZ25_16070, partial [Planctomycetes bacterium]|nr:hypothetical protein [Planctomycetota bacterium]
LRWVRKPRDLKKFHTVRVVGAGPTLRIYVDDILELECLDRHPSAGSFYLRGVADFDNIRVSDDVAANEALMVLPEDGGKDFMEENSYVRLNIGGPRVKDRALVFRKDQAVRLPVQIVNWTEESRHIRVRAFIDRFGDALAGEPQEMEISIGRRNKKIKNFQFQRIGPGFYQLNLTLLRGKDAIRTTAYPVFVGVPDKPVDSGRPAFPFGVFLRTIVWKPIHTKTYWHAIASSMREHDFNTVVATGGCHREFPEIFRHYGIFTLVRSENRIEHPAVLGVLSSATDPEQMLKRQGAQKKFVLTYQRVEYVGSSSEKDPLEIWKETAPRIRLLRIHPFKRGKKNWLAGEDNELPLQEALERVDREFDTPWWALLQACGDEGTYRNPTPAELRAETHLAIAHGAAGVLYYSFQGGRELRALVQPISLKPVDSKLRTLGELGALVEKNAELIRTLKPGKHAVRCGEKKVVVVSLLSKGKLAIYAINTDANKRVSCALTFQRQKPLGQVYDVYADKKLNSVDTTLSLDLKPGEGRLLLFKK